MKISTLVDSMKNYEILYDGDGWEREIETLSVDSRKKEKSSLFFCLSGGNIDSHSYAQEAIANGAVAIVTERALAVNVPQIVARNSREFLAKAASVFYGEPTKRLKVIGVTGTNGKTTTSYMLGAILEENEKKTGIIGTLGIKFGEKEYETELTTPDPIRLQEIFAEMLIDGVEYVVMEVSAHALYYEKIAGVTFCACIFTNFTQDHLDFFKTMDAYKQAKLSLFRQESCPIAVVNGDDDLGRLIGQERQSFLGKTVFYGLNTPTDAFAIVTDERLYGTECIFNVNDKLCRIALSLCGRHNVYNALGAAACAIELGVSTRAVARGLTKLKGVKGRLERIARYRDADVYVDFAHTPDGLSQSLETLKKHCQGRLICLFGCGGNRDKEKRPLMGETAAKKCDFAILTSDNPRYEEPLTIIADIEKGYRRFSNRYVVVPDRERAIGYALEFLQAEDILLIAGKGGEEYQEIMGIKYLRNDHDMVTTFLKGKGIYRL